MKALSRVLGPVALALTVVPAVVFAVVNVGEETLRGDALMKGLMLVGCVLWFVVAPSFMPGGDR